MYWTCAPETGELQQSARRDVNTPVQHSSQQSVVELVELSVVEPVRPGRAGNMLPGRATAAPNACCGSTERFSLMTDASRRSFLPTGLRSGPNSCPPRNVLV